MMLGVGHIHLNHVSLLHNNVNFSHYGHVKYVGHVSARDRISVGDKTVDDPLICLSWWRHQIETFSA